MDKPTKVILTGAAVFITSLFIINGPLGLDTVTVFMLGALLTTMIKFSKNKVLNYVLAAIATVLFYDLAYFVAENIWSISVKPIVELTAIMLLLNFLWGKGK